MILDKYFLEQATISSSRPVYRATSRCSDCVYSWGTLSPPPHSPCCQVAVFLSGAVAKTVLMMASQQLTGVTRMRDKSEQPGSVVQSRAFSAA